MTNKYLEKIAEQRKRKLTAKEKAVAASGIIVPSIATGFAAEKFGREMDNKILKARGRKGAVLNALRSAGLVGMIGGTGVGSGLAVRRYVDRKRKDV